MIQAFSLGALTAAQLVLGLLLQVVVIAKVGVGAQTDAWVAAQAIPIVVVAIATVAMQGTWQSMLVVAASDTSGYRVTLSRAQGQLLIALGATVAILVAAAPLWTQTLFPAFTPEQHSLTLQMSVLLLAGTLLNGHSALFTAALRARQRYVLPEVVVLSGNALAIVIALLLIPAMGVIAAAWAYLLRSAAVAATLFVLSGRVLPAPVAAWRDAESWRRLRPLMTGLTVSKSGPLVDRFFGSLAPAGGLTTLNLALMGMTALASVLERAFCTVHITSLASLANARDFAGMRRIYRQCLKRAALAACVVLLALLILLPVWSPLAKAVLGLEPHAANQIWWFCLLLVVFLVPASAGTAITFSFYAFNDTSTPARVGTIGFLISIVLKAAGFFFFGLTGIVLSIVIYYAGSLAVQWWLIERRLVRETAGAGHA
jgi:putative peptidoglycan lipid II flippase